MSSAHEKGARLHSSLAWRYDCREASSTDDYTRWLNSSYSDFINLFCPSLSRQLKPPSLIVEIALEGVCRTSTTTLC